MKKLIIGSLVGAIILFVWSFLSWVVLPLHQHIFMYTPAQDSLLQHINGTLTESGAYMLPTVDNRNVKSFDMDYKKKEMEFHEKMGGAPFAMIFYTKEGMTESAKNFIFGFLFQWVMVFCASLFVLGAREKLGGFFGRWWLVLMVAVLMGAGQMMGWNWMGMPWHYVKDMVLTGFLDWALVGVWLAWYFRS